MQGSDARQGDNDMNAYVITFITGTSAHDWVKASKRVSASSIVQAATRAEHLAGQTANRSVFSIELVK
jgi:hypothetical protein